MQTKIIKIFKKIIIGFLILYSYNMIVPASALIPINLITIIVTTLFGIPGLIALIIIKILIY